MRVSAPSQENACDCTRVSYSEIGSKTVKTKRGKAGRREAIAINQKILSWDRKLRELESSDALAVVRTVVERQSDVALVKDAQTTSSATWGVAIGLLPHIILHLSTCKTSFFSLFRRLPFFFVTVEESRVPAHFFNLLLPAFSVLPRKKDL